MIRTQQQLVTPRMAEKMLSNNFSLNRRIKHQRVEQIASDIKHDLWITTHQPIAFDFNGVLIDGQHRLMAIIEADKGVEMMVSTGLAPESYKNIDRGVTRSLADILHRQNKEIGVYSLACKIIRQDKAPVTIYAVEQSMRVLEDYYQDLIVGCNVSKKIVSTAPIILGLIVNILLKETTLETAIKNYTALVYNDFGYLSNHQILRWFYKKMMNSEVATRDPNQLLAISMFIFNDKNKDKTMMRSIDNAKAALITKASKKLGSIINLNGGA